MPPHSTDYFSTFIQCSPDTRSEVGTTPSKPGTVAHMQYERLTGSPYSTTSDDLLFEIHAARNGISENDGAEARQSFFSKGQPCLRSSPLVKSYGWGVHFDAEGKIAILARETSAYKALATRDDLTQLKGMRSSRA